MSDSPYGYLVFRIEVGDGPDQMVYFNPRKYVAKKWVERTERPDDFYIVRCKGESFVRVRD